MKNWLLTQAIIYFPSLSFCLLMVTAFLLAPADEIVATARIETQVQGVNLSRRSSNGRVLNLQSARLKQHHNGVIDIENVRVNVQHDNGALILNGPHGNLDADREWLTLSDTVGDIQLREQRATVSLGKVRYRLADGYLRGQTVIYSQGNSHLRSDTITVNSIGQIVMEGNVHAVFSASDNASSGQ